MAWIQHTLGNSQKRFLLALLLLLCNTTFAQQERLVLPRPTIAVSIIKQNQFFIQDVEDKRKTPGSLIGRIVTFGKETPLFLPKSLEHDLFLYWSSIVPKQGDAYLPLYITVKDLQINEKRIAPNKVTGDGRLTVTFRWYRNMEAVELTNFQTSVNYSRPEREYDHAKLVSQMLDQAVLHFHKWMMANIGKSPALARNLILRFKEITGKNDGDTVFYSTKRPLVWDDFRGKGRPGSRYAAAVFTSFAYEGKSFPEGPDLILEIGLKTFMVKSMSWASMNARNANTISHEQLHFDITRLVVERFKERLKKADLTIEDFDSELQYQFLESYREMNTDQENYDNETGHGINAGLQAKWERKVNAEIERIQSVQ